MSKSKAAPFILVFSLFTFHLYLPAFKSAPCSCGDYETCPGNHDCPRCTMKKQTGSTSPDEDHCPAPHITPNCCGGGQFPKTAAPHSDLKACRDKNPAREAQTPPEPFRKNRIVSSIINPDCSGGKTSYLLIPTGDPVIICERFTFKYYGDGGLLTPAPQPNVEPVTPSPPEKPPSAPLCA